MLLRTTTTDPVTLICWGLQLSYKVNDTTRLTDPLASWWKMKVREYPNNNWRLSRNDLALPATAASSERAFRLAGLILSAKQACITGPFHRYRFTVLT